VNWVTQLFLGAALGEWLLGRQLGKRALAWGAFIGVLPEFNLILHPLLDHAHKIAILHGPSHSLLVIALAAFALGRGLSKLWIHEKITRIQATSCVATLWTAHLIADCATSRGAALLWPFSGKSISFNHLFETDILITAILGITVVWLTFLPPPSAKKPRGKMPVPRSKRRQVCLGGLGLCAGYILLSLSMKGLVSAGFAADLERRGIHHERRMEAPMPHQIFLWRALVDRGDAVWIGYRSVFEKRTTPVRWTIYPRGAAALDRVSEMRETKTLQTITDGWWIARPHVKGAWLGDLRHAEIREWGVKKGMVDSRPAASWLILADATGDALRPSIATPTKTSDTLKRQTARLIGRRDSWEANPRLAGISGSLPEFLAVEE
jgi:inner membrane protein